MISIQQNIRSTEVLKISVDIALNRIRDGKSRDKIEKLRESKDPFEKKNYRHTESDPAGRNEYSAGKQEKEYDRQHGNVFGR